MSAARRGKWSTWRRSSHSSGTSGNTNCVEVAWRRSSHSGASGNNDCVEVAAGPDLVGVRDSKNLPGPVLTVPAPTWRELLSAVRSHH